MGLRTGVDMIEVARIERAIARHGERFLKRFFTPAERAYCADHPRRLGARLAAKEAVAKALGTGIGDVRWVDIEIVNDARGRPGVVLHGEAVTLARRLGLSDWDISLSHTQDMALAFVVALQGETHYG
ncbi:MAG: holo-ACP synthase [Anaerolineales bacterium]